MLKDITLSNFKCLVNEKIEFSYLNLLTGLNGTGKSTLIQSLLLLRQNFELGLLQRREISLNGDLVRIGTANDLLYQYYDKKEVGITINTDLGSALWLWDCDLNKDFIKIKNKKIDLQIFKSSLFTNNFQYLSAERIGPREFHEVATHKVVDRNDIGIKGEFVVDYLVENGAKNIAIPALSHESAEGQTLNEQVSAWMGELRGSVRLSALDNLDMSIARIVFEFTEARDVGNKFRPTNVGFGFSYTLPVIVSILSSKPGDLLIIENPEAHLHPSAQVSVAHLMVLAAKNGVQLLVESHSDHILNGIRVNVKKLKVDPEIVNVMYFNAEAVDNKITHYIQYPKLTKDGRIEYWPKGFFDEIERQLHELI